MFWKESKEILIRFLVNNLIKSLLTTPVSPALAGLTGVIFTHYVF